MTAGLQLRLVGKPELTGPEGPIKLRTRKHLALLCYLALERRPHPRDRLVDLLWPNAQEDRGKHSLSQALTELRSVLGQDGIVVETETISLGVEIGTDVNNGVGDTSPRGGVQLLEGFDFIGGVEFEHWIDQLRSSRNEERRLALIERLRSDQESGDIDRIAESAAALYEVDAFNDEAVLALAESKLLAEDPDAALHLLRRHATQVRVELKREPSDALTGLAKRLQLGQVPTDQLPEPRVELIGREEEVARLESLWNATKRGRSTTCLIEADPGQGMTTLLEAFAERIEKRRHRVFQLHCHAVGARTPYAVVLDLIRILLADTAVSATAPELLAEASRIAPEIKTTYPGIPEPISADGESLQVRLAGAIHQMLVSVTDGEPFLITIDDIHHIDSVSGKVLFMLQRRLENEPCLVLAGKLEGSELPITVDETTRLSIPGTATLHLMAESFAPDMNESGRLKAVSLCEGNARLLEALTRIDKPLASGERTIPITILHETLERAMSGSHPVAWQLLEVLGIATVGLDHDDLASILGIDTSTLLQPLRSLLSRGLLRMQAGQLKLRNELHREALTSRITKDLRQFYNVMIAKRLAEAGRDYPRRLALVHHLQEAGKLDEATEALIAASDAAIAAGAHEDVRSIATSLIHRASSNPGLQLILGKTLLLEGRFAEAAEHFGSFGELSYNAKDLLEAKLGRLESLHRGSPQDKPPVDELLEDALHFAEHHGGSSEVLRALQVKAELASGRGDWQNLNRVINLVTEMNNDSLEEEDRHRCSLTLGYCYLVKAEPKSALVTLAASVKSATPGRDLELITRLYNAAGIAATGAGRFTDAELYLNEAMAIAERIGDRVRIGAIADNLAVLYTELGDYTKALRYTDVTLDPDLQSDLIPGYAGRYANASLLAIETGDTTRALEMARAAVDVSAKDNASWSDRLSAACALIDFGQATEQDGVVHRGWELFDEATLGRRPILLVDRGSIGRNMRRRAMELGGLEAMRSYSSTIDGQLDQQTASGRIEAALAEAWAERNNAKRQRAVSEAKSLGLRGVVERCRKIGLLRNAP